jgi:alpha 1,3-mannosyltransferase
MLSNFFARRSFLAALLLTSCLLFYLYQWSPGLMSSRRAEAQLSILDEDITQTFAAQKKYWSTRPFSDGDFGELGLRLQMIAEYIEKAERSPKTTKEDVLADIDETLLSMLPFLKNPVKADHKPFQSLRANLVPGSRGIVIPVGKDQFRFTAHLVKALRDVLQSKLPIQIAFAGEADLPKEYQDALISLGSDIELLDILTIFNNEPLQLPGGWAIKPFALLACKFEQAILMDADAVMLQDPAVIFDYDGYKGTGTYMFHDRLLWQNVFKDRQKWWKEEMAHHKPTSALLKSLVYTEGYGEEQDSGVVVLDKRRLDVNIALLHVCWQNSRAVREQYTYRQTYGDKESWWFGFELCGVEYVFEPHYGSIAGQLTGGDEEKVCSFTIAHPDANEADKLLWYNGSLLRNKAINATEFSVPEFWMSDGEWLKGATKPDMSCMRGAPALNIRKDQVSAVERMIEAARKIDESFSGLI